MTEITISPNGDIPIGTFTDRTGETLVRIELTDVDGRDHVDLVFRRAQFVAFADHLRMVADALV